MNTQTPAAAEPGPSSSAPHKLAIGDLFKQLGSSERGLTSLEARNRLRRYGPNALEEKKKSQWAAFFGFFWGPIPGMIEAAAILALVVKDFGDFAIITALLVFNAVLGFWEEHEASSALAALKGALAQKARALRDGQWQEVDSAALVPGDVVRLRMGDVAPADVTLIADGYLSIDQAALTGESLPVSKQRGDPAYAGSIVKKGETVAVVTATGGNTFFGRTAKLVQSAGAVSHFQKAVLRIGDFLILVAVVLAAVLVLVQLSRGESVLRVAEFVLILLVASVPVAMPAVLSVTMALGAKLLAASKVIVSRLEAIEEMAGMDILCSDKTGTLTQNKLTLGDVEPWADAEPQAVLLAGALASTAADQDPIDMAVLAGLVDPKALDGYQQVKFVPFDPVSKRTEATITDADGKTFFVTKGTPQVIFAMVKLTGDELAGAEQIVQLLAAKGYRTLGVARSKRDGPWKLLGILPLFDPPRADSKETIAEAESYGVGVKMVTGDNAAIAAEIAGQLGLGTHILPATDLFTGDVTQGQLPADVAERVERAEGFAQVFPEHKYAIVKALQQRGHLVGMTGDGVNDAPALETGRRRHRRLRRHRRGAGGGGPDTDRPRPLRHHPGNRRGAADLRPHDELHPLSHRHDDRYHGVHRTGHGGLWVLPPDADHDYRPGAAGRRADHDHRLRPRLGSAAAGPLGDGSRAQRLFDPGALAVAESFGLMYLGTTLLELDRPQLQTMMFLQLVAGGHLMLFVTRAGAVLDAPLPGGQALRGHRRHASPRRVDVRTGLAGAAAGLGLDRLGLGL